MPASSRLNSAVEASAASVRAFWPRTHSSGFSPATSSNHWYGSSATAGSWAWAAPAAAKAATRQAWARRDIQQLRGIGQARNASTGPLPRPLPMVRPPACRRAQRRAARPGTGGPASARCRCRNPAPGLATGAPRTPDPGGGPRQLGHTKAMQRPPGHARHRHQPQRPPAQPGTGPAQGRHQQHRQQADHQPAAQQALQRRVGTIARQAAGEDGAGG